ncbi:hypothetical protein JB92DRAFT_3108245 [Gautieria morchelliformis]|nr:hypothetical protein JB92DRAFT_3108245 [Gautieria morchelliformis]
MPSTTTTFQTGDEIKKGHVCPPSTATHPEDRWETAFVYSFICKFTKLRQEVDGLEIITDLEEALLFNGPHQVIEQILARFILNLRPQTRNIGPEVISSTVAAFFAEWMAKSERTTFWDERQMRNLDPFAGQDPNGFFKLSWDLKLRILRQLVEWQLSHSVEIKGVIDRGWGVVHMKHKKSNVEVAQETQPLPDSDPYSKPNLVMVPLGQDAKKKRFWAIDASPRLYVSTNPWKVKATFNKISTTKDEYLQIIEDLRETAPPPAKKRTKSEAAHFALIQILESRIEAVDAELQRVARARKKLLQRQVAAAQVAEVSLRGPRTRRSTYKPDYVYHTGEDDEDDEQEYIDDDYQDRMDDEADFINDGPLSDDEFEDGGYGRSRRPRRAAALAGTERRRSTRSAVTNANGRNSHTEWRGERRSSRLGALPDQALDLPPPAKRSRTSASATPSLHDEPVANDPAPTLRPNEVALPSVAGKKKSKYWFYAVEPVPGAPLPFTDGPPLAGPSGLNGSSDPTNGLTHLSEDPGPERRESEYSSGSYE